MTNYLIIIIIVIIIIIKIFYNLWKVNCSMDSGMVPFKLLLFKYLFRLNNKKYY